MLTSATELKKYTFLSLDGSLGPPEDFYFEDREWMVRFITCDAGSIFGRKVLIPPQALEGKPDNCTRTLRVNATRETVKNSPLVDAEKPVSRSHQHILDRYYSFHIPSQAEIEASLFELPFVDSNIHNTRELSGFGLKTRDGELAAVEDFIINDDLWSIRYLVLQTGLWLPGKKFLLDPHWIDEISWPDKRVFADIPADKIRTCPDYEPGTAINLDYQRAVQNHFGYPKYSTKKALEDIIRRKAQELYAKRGATPGNDWADWFEAERLVKEELNRMIQKKALELCARKRCKPGEEWHNNWVEAERIVREGIRNNIP